MSFDVSVFDTLDLEDDQRLRSPSRRDQYATDFGTREADGVSPDLVLRPRSTAEVSAILACANEHQIPVTPFAAGTSMEGHPIPVEGGVTLDMTEMDGIIDVHPDDLQVTVEAGTIGSAIDEAVASYGLFFPPLPSSGDISTIGGMIANDASGMKTVKYGTVSDWVRTLRVVLADGTVIETGSRAAKSSSGYNLRDLIVGSEGTLGVITAATLELAGRPEVVCAGRVAFPTTSDAATTVSDAMQSGVDMATIELLDPLSMRMANAYVDTGLPEQPTIFFELHGNQTVEEELAFFRAICEDHDASEFEASMEPGAFDRLFESRREIGHALVAFDPDLDMLTVGDVAVPIGSYPDMMDVARRLGAAHDLLIPCFGHAGDGNIHYTVLVDMDDPEHVERGWEAAERIIEHALDLGGTATGEHGIGRNKRHHLVDEHGERQVELMREIKHAFDPHTILNPGKVIPDRV